MDEAQGPEIVSEKRTTKYLTGTFNVTFHGRYLDPEECAQSLIGWLYDGLEDRDDLRTWTFSVEDIREVEGDPEGYDD